MPESRILYPPEFRQQMIELVRSGRSPGFSVYPPSIASSRQAKAL